MRLAAFVAAAAGAAAVLASPSFATAYHTAYPESGSAPFWLVPDRPLVTFGDAEQTYQAYGRAFFVAVLLQLPASLALSRLGHRGATTTERWGVGLVLAGLLLVSVGVFTDYWVSAPPGPLGELAGALALGVGYTLIGAARHNAAADPRWASIAMMLTGPGIVVGTFLTAHVPSGPMLPFNLLWVALGVTIGTGQFRSSPTR